MYFESSKKTYYRFPSANSVHQMDSKNYFPDKPYASGENIRREEHSDHFAGDMEMFMLIK